MNIFLNLTFFAYCATLAIIALYCLLQLHLLWHSRKDKTSPKSSLGRIPHVTVQLPIFNEKYVVERLIDAVMQLDYPKDRFEVQVLDDSTDETVDIVRRKVEAYRRRGFNIQQIQRERRQGFKAGALRDGMATAQGEFIAIFDADFLPKPDFLRKTLPVFSDEKTGVVQTRWEHLNERYSLLTRLQALMLNVHFRVEQQGRFAGGYLLQFNGTAGVWRRSTIEDAGGWQPDTLTEDLDLSMRAQLRGWKISYQDGVGSPAELPAEMNGLKSQQFRWMKGGAQVARKMLPKLWQSGLGFPQKLHATLQLLGSSIFPVILLMGLTSLPVFLFWEKMQSDSDPLLWGMGGLAAFVAVQVAANAVPSGKNGGIAWRLFRLVLLLPVFMAMMMGLALHNSIAVVEGWLGKQSAFVRTPKFNIQSATDSFSRRAYLSAKITPLTILEGLLALVFLAASAWAMTSGNYSFLWLHGSLAVGYGLVFLYSLRHLSRRKRRALGPAAKPELVGSSACESLLEKDAAAIGGTFP
ncbi:MAG: glycosyltransferase [Bacteroidetes bacterium]|nr:glycosyltransferase [Bacteroidota bacterium]